jgi:glycosyl transferase family 25
MYKFYLKNQLECLLLKIRWLKRVVLNFTFVKKNKIINYHDCEIYYINLDHRVDRKKEIEDEFINIGILNAKRISAIKNDNGALGCAMSHKLIFTLALSNSKLTWVCEDDVTFLTTKGELDKLINDFYNDSRLDVLSISYNALYKIKVTKQFYITSNTQTMSCYILKPHVLNDFLNIAEESVLALKKGNLEEDYAIDQVWKKLQRKYIFALPTSVKVIQRPSFSDIRNTNVDYSL